jgi:signal transduction histidine kinase/ligand-binding sensor domain-containing protein
MLKNRLAFVIAGLICAAFSCASSHAARTLVPAGSQFGVDVRGIEDRLPQSSVLSVAQTADGYLWLGTLNGLVRFDGLKFTLFDESNTPGLNSSRVLNVFEDTKRNLWVGTENGTVSMIGTNGTVRNFTLGQGTSGGRFNISEDSRGRIWMLTGAGILGQYESGQFSELFAGCKAMIAERPGNVWLGMETNNNLGDAWIATMVELQNTPITSVALIVQDEVQWRGRLDFLLASKGGGYWRLAEGRVQKWKGDQRERDFGPYPWGTTPVLAACEDREGNLIVGTYGDGVYWLQPDGTFMHLLRELSHSSVLSVAVDREGNLWVGTNGGGLNRIKRKVFATLAGSEGLVVQSVCEDKHGGLWTGYNGESRVDYFRGGTNQTFRIISDPGIAPNCDVKSVFVDGTGRVLAGIRFNGDPRDLPDRLFEFREGRFRAVAGTAAVNENVSVLYQDGRGVLWAGLQTGLARRDEGGWTMFTSRDGLAGDEVRAVCEDRKGNLWVATGSGLSRFNDGRFISFHKSDGLPSDDLSCLFVDAEGSLWVGTRGSGLARLKDGRWIQFTTGDGLIGNSIGYILEDGEKNLWIGSNAGLMRIPKKSLDDFAEQPGAELNCRGYNEADGLPTRECTQGSQPAACLASDGSLWFPTARGLVSVVSSALRQNPYQPPVIIESILVEGTQQLTNRLRAAAPEVIRLPPGREHLEIHYTSLNLGAADQSRFRYRLEGYEKDWNLVGAARSVRYPKLPPGTYHFQVSAANEDGIWNPAAAIQRIEVIPPFWRTAWFIGLVALVALGFVVATVHYLSTQRLQRELVVLKQQEELEKERSRIARDLHDQLGANLMQVALLGELAESDKHLPEEVEGHARQIYETARETTKALDEIVWAVNPSNDTLDGLVNYICKYAQEYYELAGLRYRIEVPAELPTLTLQPEVRHNLFLAAKEAVNNVVKHAQASSAWLRLKIEPDRFTIEIEDDGRGLGGMNEKSGRNGLRNMRKRLEDVGGSFSIAPAPEKGAVVRLSAPIKNS